MSRPDDGDFLARWSARKLRARGEPATEPAPLQAPPAVPADDDPSFRRDPEKSDAEILRELGLPDPDNLVKGDDFRAFMRAGVPARLRNRALRKLWLSDPVLANLDGLNDYDQDFTDAATVMPALKTAYNIGRGFLRNEPETPPAAAEAAPDAAAEAPVEAPAEPPGETDSAPPLDAAEASGPDIDPGPDAAHGPETAAAARPGARRMRFRFDGR